MATKLYFHNATTTEAGTLPASNASVSATSPTQIASGTNRSMNRTIGVSQSSVALTTQANVNAQPSLIARFVSERLAAQTFALTGVGDISLSIAGSESNAASDFKVRISLATWTPSTGAVATRIHDLATNATLEPGTSQTSLTSTNAAGGTSASVTDGDLLICEVWRDSTVQTNGTARTNTVFFDGTTEASTTTNAAFINFPNDTLIFAPQRFTQAQAQIKAIGVTQFTQAQGQIKGIGVKQYTQAQTDIKQTYNQFTRSQCYVCIQTNRYTQAQTDIKQTYTKSTQAQALVAYTTALDLFNRSIGPSTWGDADVGGNWRVQNLIPGASDALFEVNGTRGLITAREDSIGQFSVADLPGVISASPTEFYAVFRLSQLPIGPLENENIIRIGLRVKGNPLSSTVTHYYLLSSIADGSNLGSWTVQNVIDGVPGSSGGFTTPQAIDSVNTDYSIRIQVENVGSTVHFRLKVWLTSGTEPDAFRPDYIDSSPGILSTGGAVYLGIEDQKNGTVYSWDNLSVTQFVSNQKYTQAQVQILEPTRQFTQAQAYILKLVFYDEFNRDTTGAEKLGVSDSGHTYSQFDVTPNYGRLLTTNTTYVSADLAAAVAPYDDDLRTTVNPIVSIAGESPSVLAQAQYDFYVPVYTTANNYAYSFYDIQAAIFSSTQWRVRFTNTLHVEDPFDRLEVVFTATAGTWYTAKVLYAGNTDYSVTSYMKVWQTGTPEPDWQDSVQADNFNAVSRRVSFFASGGGGTLIGVNPLPLYMKQPKVWAQKWSSVKHFYATALIASETKVQFTQAQAYIAPTNTMIFFSATDHTAIFYTDPRILAAEDTITSPGGSFTEYGTAFLTAPLNAVTITGSAFIHISMKESAASVNAYPYMVIDRTDYLGNFIENITTITDNFPVPGEIPTTYTTLEGYNDNITPSVSLNTGDRLKIRIGIFGLLGAGNAKYIYGSPLGHDNQTTDPEDAYIILTNVIEEQKLGIIKHWQAQAKIKAINVKQYTQAQAQINAYGVNQFTQAQTYIDVTLATYEQFTQAQADILQTYQSYWQAQCYVQVLDVCQFTQAQANIKQTYTQHTQAQADILQVYQAYCQAQADIKQTYTQYTQAQCYIKVTDICQFTQAQVNIKQEYQGYCQAQCYIKTVDVNQFTQAQGTILQIYQQYVQAQANIKQTYVACTQAQTDIKQTYIQHTQAQCYIKVTDITQYAQAQADILQTYVACTQAQADIKATYVQCTQAQVSILQTYQQYAQAQTDIKQVYVQCTQAQTDIKQTYVACTQAQTNIKATYTQCIQAQCYIRVLDVNQYTQAQTSIKQVYVQCTQAQCSIKQTYTQHTQAQAKLNAFGTTQHCQAQTNIAFQGAQGFWQAQAKINAFGYNQHTQAQTSIKATYNQYCQAQTSIRTTYNQYTQSQTDIKQSYQQYCQAQADIKQTYQAYTQAQSDIKQTYVQCTQAQTSVKQTYNACTQAQTNIKQTYVQCTQAQCYIKVTSQAYTQAQCYVILTVNQYTQAQVSILTTANKYTQAQTDIKATSNQYTQAQCLVGAITQAYMNAQTTIKAVVINTWQAQASIQAVYTKYTQAQGYITLTDICAFTQAQASILKTAAYMQAQALIKTVHTLANVTVSDDELILVILEDDAATISIRLQDTALIVTLEDEDATISITLEDTGLIITLEDEAYI